MEDMFDENFDKNKVKNKLKITISILSLFVLIVLYFLFSSPFGNNDVVIHISEGESHSEVYKELKDKNSIRSINSLKFFIKVLGANRGMSPGDYLIKSGSPVYNIAFQIVSSSHGINPIKVTLIEGLTGEEMANIFESKISNFNKEDFLQKIKSKEGFLFPDTYFIFPQDSVDEIILKLSSNFNNRIKPYLKDIEYSGKNINNIITMASILEGEANGINDVYLISGILWKRISIGMSLQVDIDKGTYFKKGLPEHPLNNPGLISIKASINPQHSDYLYYLHDKNGQVHFAKTYDEHRKNINNYLK